MRRGFWAGGAAALILLGAVACFAIVPAAEPPGLPIAGTAPGYGPKTVSAAPNPAAVLRRIWMPGLDAGYDPQGLAVAGNAVYVAAYRSEASSIHRGPCRVFRLDPATGAETGHLDVPSPCGHAGGLATGGDGALYIADTHMLFAIPLDPAFGPAGAAIRSFPLGESVTGGLAASSADGIWLGTYEEKRPGWLYHFNAATLASLHDGQALEASQAVARVTIPSYAQGAAFDDGALWVARSDMRWGTLDRLEPATGASYQRYDIAPGTEGIALDGAGHLWAVSEAGARHFYDHPFAGLIEPFYPLVFALDLARLR